MAETRFDRDELFVRFDALAVCRADMEKALGILCEAARSQKIMVCGNGGSAADSLHIVGELSKGFLKKRELSPDEKALFNKFGEDGKRLADGLQNGVDAVSLVSETALLSAFANDADPALCYAQAAWSKTKKGDALIAISTSGNSGNVFYAAAAVKARGGYVVSLTGAGGGKLAMIADAAIRVPAKETYLVQEYHLPVYHWLCAAVEDELFG
ncbi:MAG: SIS domain-containing protein [Clostridia bacterium]|nr:SIS domain-containing protein [Clostridia bacterium]